MAPWKRKWFLFFGVKKILHENHLSNFVFGQNQFLMCVRPCSPMMKMGAQLKSNISYEERTSQKESHLPTAICHVCHRRCLWECNLIFGCPCSWNHNWLMHSQSPHRKNGCSCAATPRLHKSSRLTTGTAQQKSYLPTSSTPYTPEA